MADYQSQFSGAEIDARLAAIPGKQDRLVSGQNIKTINDQSILGPGNITIQGGSDFTITSNQDGTFTITFSSGDSITIDLNHNHPAYPKYQLLNTETEYNNLQVKESDTLYLIKESQS